jgi:hypothetical protein
MTVPTWFPFEGVSYPSHTVVTVRSGRLFQPRQLERGDSSLTVNGDNTMSKTTTTTPTRSASTRCRRRRVSFDLSEKKTIYVQPLHQLNDEERAAMFLTQDDYTRIRQELKDSVRSIIQQQQQAHTNQHSYHHVVVDDCAIEFTTRGLETKAAQVERRLNQRQARDAVLNEQNLQQIQQQYIPEVTAMLYNVFAFPSQQRAYKLAVQDRLSVHGETTTTTDTGHNNNNNNNSTSMTNDDSMMICDSVVTQLVRQHNPHMSVEDWLLGRFQVGQHLAETRRHLYQQYPNNNNNSKRRRSDTNGNSIITPYLYPDNVNTTINNTPSLMTSVNNNHRSIMMLPTTHVPME